MESKSKFTISIIAKDIYKLYLKQELAKYHNHNFNESILVNIVNDISSCVKKYFFLHNISFDYYEIIVSALIERVNITLSKKSFQSFQDKYDNVTLNLLKNPQNKVSTIQNIDFNFQDFNQQK